MPLREIQEVIRYFIKYIHTEWFELTFFFQESIRLGLGINLVDHRISNILSPHT